MFNFLKKLFGIKDTCCCECHCKYKIWDVDGPDKEDILNEVIIRRDYKIVIPTDIKTQLDNNKISISVTKHAGKTSCVQLFKTIEGKSKYMGTLKAYMNVKSFKDGDVCNFSRDNLIYKGENND